MISIVAVVVLALALVSAVSALAPTKKSTMSRSVFLKKVVSVRENFEVAYPQDTDAKQANGYCHCSCTSIGML